MGLFFVDEAPEMLLHHVATLCISFVVSFFKCGFRYYAPFFLGVIEISSVPLSIINFFKNNKEWAADVQFNKLLQVARVSFAFLFLLNRVVLWIPQIYGVLRGSILLGYTCKSNACRMVTGSFTISATYLTCLQLYWGSA